THTHTTYPMVLHNQPSHPHTDTHTDTYSETDTLKHTHTYKLTNTHTYFWSKMELLFTFFLYSLSWCSITEEGFSSLASALRSNPSHMRELWLNGNKAGDSGVKHLSSLLEDPNCKLEKLE